MPRWLARMWSLRGGLLAALERFPVAVMALAAFALLVNFDIAGAVDLSTGTIARAGMALVGAAALAAAFVLLSERRAYGLAARHAGSLLLAVAIGGPLWFWERFAIAGPALFAAAMLAIPLAPYLRRAPDGFWDFVWRLVHAVALAFIAIIVFCLGLSAILASLEYLFGFKIDGTVYGHVWSTGLGFVGPLFALSLVPVEFPERDAVDRADIIVAGVRLLADFVAVPLLAVFALILHVYAAKIAVTAEWPKNQIGWMVLSFGLSVLALRIIVHPFAEPGRWPTRLFLRWWAVPLAVPLLLLVVAASQRIADLGVTPERYGLALFALFLALTLAAQLHPRLRGDIRAIPAFGALCLLFASFGPWSVIPVSAQSQVERLTARLSETGALDGVALAAGSIEWERGPAEDVLSILRMLDEIGQIERLRPLFAGGADHPFPAAEEVSDQQDRLLARVQRTFNVETLPPLPDDVGRFQIAQSDSAGFAIEGYDLVVAGLSWSSGYATALSVADATLDIRIRTDAMEVAAGDARLRITPDMLRNAIAGRIAAVESQPGRDQPPFFIELALEGKQVGLLFEALAGRITAEEISIEAGRFTLLIRAGDWTD